MFLICVYYAKQVKIPTNYSAWHLRDDKCELVLPLLVFHLRETRDSIIAQAVLFWSCLFVCFVHHWLSIEA